MVVALEAPKVVRRADYKPPEYDIESVEIVFSIIDETRVEVSAVLEMKCASSEIDAGARTVTLDAIGIDINSDAFQVNGAETKFEKTETSISFTAPKTKGETFQVSTKHVLDPSENKQLLGLYASPDGDSTTLLTQLEAEGMRRLIPFFDRPDVKPKKWKTTILAEKDKFSTLLATGEKTESKDLENGRHSVTFESDVPMSPYLYAMAAGKFEKKEKTITLPTKGGGEKPVLLEAYVTPEKIHEANFMISILEEVLRWDAEENGLYYPLSVYRMLATRAFNAGAMENLGFNIFNTALSLVNYRLHSDERILNSAHTVEHEGLHTHSGNSATGRTWHEIGCPKEGLNTYRDQKFMEHLIGKYWSRVKRISELKRIQFREDNGASAKAVLLEEYTGDPIHEMYNATRYEKGGEIIRMLEVFFGEIEFKRALQHYFEKFEGKTVTTEELIDAIFEMKPKNCLLDREAFFRWYRQEGTPTCRVEKAYDPETQKLHLTVRQEIKDGQEPLHFPLLMGLIGASGQEIPLKLENSEEGHDLSRGLLYISQKEQVFMFTNVMEDAVPSLLRGFSAPVKLKYEYSYDNLKHLIEHDTDVFNQHQASERLALQCMASLAKSTDDKLQIPDKVLDAYETILQKTEGDDSEADFGIVAEMLKLPDIAIVVQEMKPYDYQKANTARNTLKKAIAARFETQPYILKL
ncbi:DUF3458 domain-containing protein [Candidatus Peregrinibacteria bacterium]|nr:DUF3458 domain-containing protein [Candidatus Peregrinibacteria bacterium]